MSDQQDQQDQDQQDQQGQQDQQDQQDQQGQQKQQNQDQKEKDVKDLKGAKESKEAKEAKEAKELQELSQKLKESLGDLYNKDMRTFLSTMEERLNKQSKTFQDQARKIAYWDRMIFDCIALVKHLEDQVKTTDEKQKDLERLAKELLQEQEDFIKKMKENAQKKTYIPTQDDQRDRIYNLSQDLGNKYSDMETQLKEMVEHVEKSRHFSEVSSDMDKMAMITNCHMHSLQWISDQCKTLDKQIEKLKKSLPESYSIPK